MTSHRDATLPAGPWHGHFAYSREPMGLNPTALTLSLDGDAIEGAGADHDGEFDLRGVRDGAQVRWQKRYRQPGGPRVVYAGAWDQATGELSGRWRLVHSGSHGRFSLRPGEGSPFDDSAARARAFLKRRAKEWQALCDIDLEAVRFDGERAVLTHLLADPDYVRLMRDQLSLREEADVVNRRATLSSARVRLRRPMVPGLFALLDRCVDVLGLRAPVDLYCVNDGAANACVSTTPDRRIVIEVTAGAINQLDAGEMLYVLGHEIAHALLGHLETPRLDSDEGTGLTALRSYALQRYEEISADRVGLLCCDDVQTALRAEFVMTTGIVNRAALGAPGAFLEHARQTVAALDAPEPTLDEGFATHPHGELRALAIDLFGRSRTFHRLLGREQGELDERALEREVARLVRLMNPSVLERGLAEDDVSDFILLGALSVAGATGGVVASEKKVLKRLAAGQAKRLAKLEALSFEEQQIRMLELAEVLVVTLPAPTRVGLMDELTVVARADGRVSKGEQAALEGIAELLGVGAGSVDETLDALDAPLD